MDTEDRERKRLEKKTREVQTTWKQHKRQNESDNNPCLEESKLSIQCIEENYSRRELCNRYFEAYKNCKKYWHSVMRERIIRGIKPPMPTHEEREKIKKELGVNFVIP